MAQLPQADLDKIILSFVTPKPHKTSAIIAQVAQACESKQIRVTHEQIAERIYFLRDAGQLEAYGTLSRWKHSDICLPSGEYSRLSQAELDRMILSFVETRWQKTARVMMLVLVECEPKDILITEEEIAERIYALEEAGRFEVQGPLSAWRFSEIRWPRDKSQDTLRLSRADLDEMIMSYVLPPWQKTSMIVARVLHECEYKKIAITHEEIVERVYALHGAGKIESQGTITKWRHSEIRWPSDKPLDVVQASLAELDEMILSFVDSQFCSAGMIVAQLIDHCESKKIAIAREEIVKLIYALHAAGKIESRGTLSIGEDSDIRLPERK